MLLRTIFSSLRLLSIHRAVLSTGSVRHTILKSRDLEKHSSTKSEHHKFDLIILYKFIVNTMQVYLKIGFGRATVKNCISKSNFSEVFYKTTKIICKIKCSVHWCSCSASWIQVVNFTYVRSSDDILDVFWMSFVCTIYVLCPEEHLWSKTVSNTSEKAQQCRWLYASRFLKDKLLHKFL